MRRIPFFRTDPSRASAIHPTDRPTECGGSGNQISALLSSSSSFPRDSGVSRDVTAKAARRDDEDVDETIKYIIIIRASPILRLRRASPLPLLRENFSGRRRRCDGSFCLPRPSAAAARPVPPSSVGNLEWERDLEQPPSLGRVGSGGVAPPLLLLLPTTVEATTHPSARPSDYPSIGDQTKRTKESRFGNPRQFGADIVIKASRRH